MAQSTNSSSLTRTPTRGMQLYGMLGIEPRSGKNQGNQVSQLLKSEGIEKARFWAMPVWISVSESRPRGVLVAKRRTSQTSPNSERSWGSWTSGRASAWATGARRRKVPTLASATTRWPYCAKLGERRLSCELDDLVDLFVVVVVNSLDGAGLGKVVTTLGLQCHCLGVYSQEEVEVSAVEAIGEAVAVGHEEVGPMAQGCLACVGVVGVLERGTDGFSGQTCRLLLICCD